MMQGKESEGGAAGTITSALDKFLLPILVAITIAVLGAGAMTWQTAANSVPRETYYKDISELSNRLARIEEKMDSMKESLTRLVAEQDKSP